MHAVSLLFLAIVMFYFYCEILTFLVRALESRHKGGNTLSVRNMVVDEKRTRPGHWLVLVLFVPFSAFTLSVG